MLYSQEDESFRTPVFRTEIQTDGFLKIPAGDHLVSLALAGKAPDLHLLSVVPGSRKSLAYSTREGWSLLLRCRNARSRQELVGARIELTGAQGFGAPGARPVETASAAKGLALISGIRHTLADATVEAAGLLAQRVSGLSASPGTFAFRDVELEEGGTLLATILLDGAPARDVVCLLLEVNPNPMGPAPEPVVRYEGRTGAEGVCKSGKLPAGPYILRVRADGGRSFLDRTVMLATGEETPVEVMRSGYVPAEPVTVAVRPEAPTPPLVVRMKKAAVIEGRIVSSGGPAGGAMIQSYRTTPTGAAIFLGRTASKPDGSFEVAAAATGPTSLYVSGAGCPLSSFVIQAARHDVSVRCAELPASLELTLKDSQGKPLPGRTVLVRAQGSFIPAPVLIEHLGQFRIQAASDGHGRLFLAGLAPGAYELYLGDATSPEMVTLGSPEGFLTSTSLAPFTTVEVEAMVQ